MDKVECFRDFGSFRGAETMVVLIVVMVSSRQRHPQWCNSSTTRLWELSGRRVAPSNTAARIVVPPISNTTFNDRITIIPRHWGQKDALHCKAFIELS